ncbi:MAG: porin [Schleiferiaceae bacterium]|jgi:phosphate-selective porin OprO/OprP|tara:strand:- start:1507 stop:2715 length:1209 start_codon:yes stop_codon:yes gene_type:complete
MNSRTSIAFAIIILCSFKMSAQQGVNEISFGKGLLNYVAADSSFSVKFAPRFQVRYYGTSDFSDDGLAPVDHDFLVRRSRFKFDGWVVHPSIGYKMEFGLSNNDMSGANAFTKNSPRYILDAVIKWKFAPGFELWAGQTKLPGNVERVISSANLQLVDRSLLNSKFNIDRDLGIQLRHTTKLGGQFISKEKFAISQGEGRNIATGNEGGLQYTGRVELFPLGGFTKKGEYMGSSTVREEKLKIMAAYTYDFNADASKTRSNMGDYMFLMDGSLHQTNITTQFIDLVMKYEGFSLMAEYADRSATNPIAVELDGTETGDIVTVGSAFNMAVGYFISEKIEVAGRYTTLNYADVTGTSPATMYTLGLNKFVVGHKLKVQGDISYSTKNGESDAIIFRTGFELHF